MKRFSAKLLFQFRESRDKGKKRRRWCEERIICFQAASLRKALARARTIGRKATYSFENANGQTIHFEIVGVLDLLELGSECNPEEVWYNIVQRVSPMERRERILPTDANLLARPSDEIYQKARLLYPNILAEAVQEQWEQR